MFNVGDRVKLTKPERGEELARYVVTEWNGDRGSIQFVCDMAIPPVELVRESDIELA